MSSSSSSSSSSGSEGQKNDLVSVPLDADPTVVPEVVSEVTEPVVQDESALTKKAGSSSSSSDGEDTSVVRKNLASLSFSLC